MIEISKQFLERLVGGEVEQVEGGVGAFDDSAYEDPEDDDDGEFEET
jgi:hypothetical protein